MRAGEGIFPVLLRRASPMIAGSALIGILAVMMGLSLFRGLTARAAGEPSAWFILQFLILLAAVTALRLMQSRLVAQSARRLALEFRIRLSRRALKAPYETFGYINRQALRKSLVSGPAFILSSIRLLDSLPLQVAQQIAGIAFIVLLAPSLLPMLLFVLMLVLAGWTWVARRALRETRRRDAVENDLSERFDELLLGFKEVSLSHSRREHLVEKDIVGAIRTTSDERLAGLRSLSHISAVTEMLLLLCAAGLAVGGPLLLAASPVVSAGAALLVLYIRSGMIAETPKIIRVFETIRELGDLLAALEHQPVATASCKDKQEVPSALSEGLELQALRYHFPGPSAFRLGPVNATIRPGNVVFLVGNNGAGKSTLIRLLAGLYAPSAGQILADGRSVGEMRETGLYSAVADDARLTEHGEHGEHGRSAATNALIRLFAETGSSTQPGFQEHQLNMPASRATHEKWLTLAVQVAGDRPVILFDDCVAGHDPAFRRWFYTKFVPHQKRLGKVVIVATHEVLYFNIADQMLMLENGKQI